MTSASLNFTNRGRIKSRFIEISILERTDEFVRVKLRIEKGALNIAGDTKIVLDAFERDRHERKLVPGLGEHLFDFNELTPDANIRFRVRQIALGQDAGLIVASTTEITPIEPKGGVERIPFFKPTPEDLGDLPWKIDWSGDTANPKLLINKRLIEHFEDWRAPALQALYLPVALRELLVGIMVRSKEYDDLESESLVSNLFDFCEKRLGQAIAHRQLPFGSGGVVADEWLEWVDDCVASLCETQWRNKKTLIDQMLEE